MDCIDRFFLCIIKSRNLFCCVEEHVSLSSPTLSQTLRFGRFSSQFVSTKFMLMPWLSWRQTCAQSGVIRHAGRNYLKLESECFANWRLHHTLIFCIFENKFKTRPKWNVFRLSKSKVNLMFWCLNWLKFARLPRALQLRNSAQEGNSRHRFANLLGNDQTRCMYHTVWTNGNPDSPKSSEIKPLAYIKHVWFQTEFRIVEHVGYHRKNGPRTTGVLR